jgi:chromosome segregation ATPase
MKHLENAQVTIKSRDSHIATLEKRLERQRAELEFLREELTAAVRALERTKAAIGGSKARLRPAQQRIGVDSGKSLSQAGNINSLLGCLRGVAQALGSALQGNLPSAGVSLFSVKRECGGSVRTP